MIQHSQHPVLYFGYPNDEKRTVSQSLIDKGIDLIRANPYDLHFDVVCKSSPYYTDFVTHFAVYMQTMEDFESHSIFENNGYHVCKFKTTIPLPLPRLAVGYHKIDDKTRSKLREINAEEIKLKGKTIYTFSMSDSDTLAFLKNAATFDPNIPSPMGVLSLNHYKVYTKVLNLFACAFYTIRYATYKVESIGTMETSIVSIETVSEESNKRKKGLRN